MVLKRPVAGDPVTVEDFGQPVYDYLLGTVVAYSEVLTTTTGITTGTDIAGLSVSFTADSSYRYRTIAQMEVTGTVAQDIFVLNIHNGTAPICRNTGTVVRGTAAQSVCFMYIEGIITGAQLRKINLSRALGTGTMSAGGDGAVTKAFIIVEAFGKR